MSGEFKMYVHEVEWDILCDILSNVNNVNKVFTYTMPNKAESYASDGFNLVEEINRYGSSEEEEWRVNTETNISLECQDGVLKVGDWIIDNSVLSFCIPAINSIIIIPSSNSLYKGNRDLTKIIQLTNCISVTPLLMKMRDVPIEGEEGKYNLGVSLEIIKEEPAE